MKDIFNRRQRFSLRKYSFGVASVLLGTALFAARIAQADEVTSPEPSSSTPSSTVAGESSANLVETPTASTAQADPTAAVSSTDATASTFNLTPEASTTDKAAAETTDKQATETAKPTEKAATETAKPATAASTNAAGNNVETTASATAASNASTTAASNASATAAPVAGNTETAETAAEATTAQPNVATRANVASAGVDVTSVAIANNERSNAATLVTEGGRRRNRRSATDPVSTSHTVGSAAATPVMSDPNGAKLKNRPLVVPTPKDPTDHVTAGINYQLNPSASQYTYIVTDLMGFNTEYNTKFYYRMSKPYDNSTNVTIELVDGATNTVKETKQISGAGTVNLGQATLAPISGNKQAYIEFRFENVKDADKTDRPALRATWKFNGSANDFDGQRTAIQIYDVVNTANEGTTITDPQYYIPRLTTKTTYYKVVDKNSSTYDPNRLVGNFVSNGSSYVMNSSTAGDYKLVNDAGTPQVDAQTYRATGSEESLGSFTLTGMEGQDFHASALRAFDGYKLYQTADSRSLVDVLKKPYEVGQRWFDVANAEGGVKRIKEVVGEDGTVRIEMWAIKSDSLNKISKDLNTDGYVKVYETVIRPGSNNKIDHPEDFGKYPEIDDAGWNKDNNKPVRDGLKPELRDKLVVGKPFAIFSDKQNTNYLGDLEYGKPNVADFIYKRPNGTFYKMSWGGEAANNTIEYTITEVSASEAAGYQPRYSAAGEFYANRGATGAAYAINGVPVSSGNVFRLENKLTPNYETVYYYVKGEATKVTPEFTKVLEDKNVENKRTLNDNDFSFKLVELKTDDSGEELEGGHTETVTNKSGKVTFSDINFTKVGTYKYKVTEVAGEDKNVDYDAMETIMTVVVTEKNQAGDLKATVTYSSSKGETSSTTDTEFNNVVVAPVKVKFDFTKKLAGRELKDGEFRFILKDANGQEVETVANKKDGTVTFTEISFDNTKVGTHTYTVEEVIPAAKEVGMTYDTMKATITVEVAKNGHTLTTVTNVTSTGGVNADGTSTEGTDDKEFNNKITPPETPEFQPEKFVLNKEKFDITGSKLVDDDDELTDEYTATNANPYADGTSNNEAENINTKSVERGEKIYYQVWLDTKNFTDRNNIQSVGISDTYDADKLTVNAADIKAYDSESGADVTDKFDIKVENGVITATSKASMNKSLGDADNTQVVDTTKFAFGRYYKFDIPATVKADVAGGVDIENKANQIVHVYNPVSKSVETPEKPTQKRVNSVPISVDFNFTKRLEGRELKANEFSFELKDSDNVVIATATNDAAGNITFSPVEYTNKAGKKVTALKYTKGQEGTYTYTVEEVAGTDATVTYDTMKANVTVTVSHDGTAKVLVANVTEPADKEFNNVVTPPTEPKFQPEKYVVSEEKFDITGDKLVDDDKELTDKYGETNTNPYADDASNNETQNLNTKSVERGDKLVYQVWLDTTKFSATNKENVQSVGISDDYDETKLDLDATKIKAYDSVTGDDVTAKFDITVEGGVITATLKAGFTKSLGDAENTQVIDTTKFAFGRYYKFDIPTTVKADVKGGVDIENTAAQVVNYYNPTTKKVEKPNKPTEKRVNNVPVEVEFNFTKRLEGRELKANEFSFVLKDSEGKTLETVSNDASGNVKFSAISFKKGQEGVHNYTVEEVKGSDATVTYDTMKANVTVTVKHDGTAKVLIATVGDIADKEFNNRVTPPEEPKFQPEKYVLSDGNGKFDITGTKLLDDDAELADKYADTNANPYADSSDGKKLSNGEIVGKNEAENINTKAVKRGETINYQVWLDTNQFDANNKDNIQTVGITDDYDEAKLEVKASDIKAYDGKTGADVTDKFDISIANGVITANLKAGFTKSLGDAENTQIIDTTKFEFGRYYKFVIPAKVTDGAYDGAEIENTAAQVVNYYNPTTKTVEKPNKPTEKRVNNVPTAIELIFGKTLNGRKLQDKEFTFELKDEKGNVLETVKNDAEGKVKFSTINYAKADLGKTFNYTVEEVKGTDTTVTYDNMKVNVTVQVIQPSVGDQLSTVISYATVGGDAYGGDDRVFDNEVTPNFKPEKYVVSEPSFDIIGNKLADDDDSADKVEIQNLNGKTLKRGQKIYYQVWLDTRDFTAESNLQTVGITDNYEEDKLDINAADIKVYDGITGADVTDKFDIKVENGVLYGTSKASLTKAISATDATPVIDTTKFEFGRYYKFDIPAVVKDIDSNDGVDIENTANQTIHQYNPFNKKVTTPEKPTQTRENNVPVPLEFNYTKRLEGRELTAGEFSFVLKDKDNKILQTVTNDKDGHIKFEKLLFNKDDLGKTFTYTVEEVAGKDASITYDAMKATVTVEVTKEGKVLTTVVNHASTGGFASSANDKEFNNKVRPPETPKFQPEKYVVSEEKFDITGDKLVDDDKELADKYADTNANPYADDASNNEKQNLNTKSVKRGEKLVYQVWLDTTKFDANNKDYIQTVGISDDYDETKLDLDASAIKAYDSVTGEDVTAKFDIKVENGMITANLKDGFTKSLGDDANTQIIDTTKFAFGRYYKFDIPTTVKDSVPGGVDIENTAGQVVHFYNPQTKKTEIPTKPTEKRVNSVPISVEFNFTKKLEGRELKANEFSFQLKDEAGNVIETVKNDASGNVKFKAIEYKKGQEGTYKYTVEEVKGTDGTVQYDGMKAVVTVEVKHDGTAKALITNVTDAADKEFNNKVTPPDTPDFNPEKYILNESKFDLTGVKLLDDDSELKDKVADTNANPYADKTDNNEAQNINTKTLKKGDKVYYQVWLDTTKFTEAHNIQSVGVTDKYDSENLTVNVKDIKAYDSVTGEDVTAKFDITLVNGVITATSKADLTKSLGDAENTQVIDTTKFAFGRYYKFEIPAEIKQSAKGGVDIENTASQIVHQYDPQSKTVKKPEKPTEKRVVNIPVEVEFNFTKKLEGRELKANEFSFVLKDKDGNILQTVKNDAAGNVKFAALEFKKGQEGTHNYTVEEVKGTDGTVSYDSMKALVTVEVSHDGKAKALITKVNDPADKEFNNTVRPPEKPKFQPEKYVVSKEKFDITGMKLVDDDAELKDKVGDTNKDPYADSTANNEAENINTKTLKKGDKFVYQVWLDTTNFTDAHNIQSVGVTDKYDSENLTVNVKDIKAYDSVTGEDVTAKFDIQIVDGVITATSKADLTKSLGDAENTQVIDTAKLAFGRYYKFDIPATIKGTAKDGVDIENTASQIVHQYDPTKKSVEKPEKPTEKRVVNIPTKVEFEFTKKLEGRELKPGEFSFVLKDSKGNVIETVSNDANGKIKFSALEYKRGEEGTHVYTVEEVQGNDATVAYDKMVATVVVSVTKDGKVLTVTSQLPEDTEFN
ncbi:SspB-related isopeptide-forming adhesin, partial [Streptococcus sp. 9.1]